MVERAQTRPSSTRHRRAAMKPQACRVDSDRSASMTSRLARLTAPVISRGESGERPRLDCRAVLWPFGRPNAGGCCS
jgi:hypothetical protein